MKLNILFLLLSIGLMSLGLSSCAGKPVRYLAQDACLVKTGMNSSQVIASIGKPDIKTSTNGKEIWYYQKIEQHFWQKIPPISYFSSSKKIWILKVVFKKHKVVNVVYYCKTA